MFASVKRVNGTNSCPSPVRGFDQPPAYNHRNVQTNDEGRALMSRDVRILQAAFDNLQRRRLLPTNNLSLAYVDAFIAALHLEPDQADPTLPSKFGPHRPPLHSLSALLGTSLGTGAPRAIFDEAPCRGGNDSGRCGWPSQEKRAAGFWLNLLTPNRPHAPSHDLARQCHGSGQ